MIAPSPAPVAVELQTVPQPHLHVLGASGADEAPLQPDLAARILAALAPRPLSRTALRERLRVRNERLGEALAELEAAGRVCRGDGLFGIPVPAT